ncbi:Alpha/Beta hydrolase protein [Chaetomidium leptoderma]|uniref:Alpha/Beta hydrolase protein n=1 Tax=Chaetomidium leptoderma TaxID=669021 RepID=A0AAN6VVK5_9PEZI|nr:Alpha/Beta hydrolase protein [Chaetomidium leptoderma]
MEFNATKAIVHNEGCDLHYWYQGTGPLITFVPGGNGHGRQYYPIMAALSDRYTCVTFDRRQMSASQVEASKMRRLSPPQQARDIRAVIRAIGFDKSIVFGSSSGGIFAFQFALDFPEMVDHLISHEAPTLTLLPDASALFESYIHLLDLYDTGGLQAASAEFGKSLIGYDDEGVPKTTPPGPENPANFWRYEFPMLVGFSPNLWRVRQNGTSVGLMRGVRSRDASYARATYEQEKILGCLRMDVPGHHQGFEVETGEFLPCFLDMLDQLEKKRG